MKPTRWVLMVTFAAVVALAAGVWTTTRWHQRPRQVVGAFHQWFAANGATTARWLGAEMHHSPLDLWVMQEILTEIKPDVLIETSSPIGGAALYYASVFDLLNHGRVIVVGAKDQQKQHPRVTYEPGSSVASETVDKIRAEIKPEEKVMVTLGSDRAMNHVLHEMILYNPLVSVGSYMIVENTHLTGHPIETKFGPGPMEAVQQFMQGNSYFEIDRTREKFGVTFNPSGFLKRVR